MNKANPLNDAPLPPPFFINSRQELIDYVERVLKSEKNLGEVNAIVKLQEFDFEPYVEEFLPAQYAELYRAVPLALINGVLVVAIDTEASRYETVNSIEFVVGSYVEVVFASPEDIDVAIDRLYSAEDLVGFDETDIDDSLDQDNKEEYIEDLRQQMKDQPVVKVVRRMLIEAIKKGASDIHIRPGENAADYLLRIDGNMMLRSKIQRRHLNAIISRFKIIANMDISEHRIPQDGGAKISIADHTVELRLSVMPTIHGESLVVRLLNTDIRLFKLEQLGLEDIDYRRLLKAAHQSHGLVLVTGPTGSGKSTTLYALLQEVKKNTGLNIITVEDPVEFHIDGVEQIQVRKKIDYTFAKALRNILRHDPDVIMVGEIRDEETAKMAIESALTGHLVTSTLHSIDAVSTVTRLLEMGVRPYLVKATLALVVAQRLVKLNCKDCLEDDNSLIAETLKAEPSLENINWKSSKGCESCQFTGLKGRQGIYESLLIDQQLRGMIKEGVTEQEIRAVADQQEGDDLATQAVKLAKDGLISADEFIRLQINS